MIAAAILERDPAPLHGSAFAGTGARVRALAKDADQQVSNSAQSEGSGSHRPWSSPHTCSRAQAQPELAMDRRGYTIRRRTRRLAGGTLAPSLLRTTGLSPSPNRSARGRPVRGFRDGHRWHRLVTRWSDGRLCSFGAGQDRDLDPVRWTAQRQRLIAGTEDALPIPSGPRTTSRSPFSREVSCCESILQAVRRCTICDVNSGRGGIMGPRRPDPVWNRFASGLVPCSCVPRNAQYSRC